jgi:acyl-CoA hydrolase
VAHVHAKSIRERAELLIEIAHPTFRDELRAWAKRANYTP